MISHHHHVDLAWYGILTFHPSLYGIISSPYISFITV
jgi:hypothetical protein